jgi:hypothetical protein
MPVFKTITNRNHSPSSSYNQAPSPDYAPTVARAIGTIASSEIIASAAEVLADIEALLGEATLAADAEAAGDFDS